LRIPFSPLRRGRHAAGAGIAAAAGALLTVLLFSGCLSGSAGHERFAGWRPDGSGRSPWAWDQVLASGPAAMATNGAFVRPDAAGAPPPAAPGSKVLRRGDAVRISLRGIPQPDEIQDVVDDLGWVTLPLIGNVPVEGLTTAEAEKAIVDRYIEAGIYSKINVTIVAQEAEYFVQGEVQKVGRYPLAGELTLLQAIAAAGGYTDFANPRKIRVIRGNEVKQYNAVRIEARREEDPLIKSNDIIIVPRGWL